MVDSNFNFGPIDSPETFSRSALTDKNWRDFLRVEPLPNPPPPLTVDQAWDSAPELFKKQFRLACRQTYEFGEVNTHLDETSKLLRKAASKLANGDPLKETPAIADYLWMLGNELRDLAEFCRIFKIPKSHYSEKQFKSFLTEIHRSFKESNLLIPTKTYDTHKSYLGTDEDWRWFLEAERLDLDIRKSADLTTLAKLYSEDLRRRAIQGAAPRRAKAHGFTDSKFSSKVIKNRRSVVKRHVLSIEKWVSAAYPRGTPEPGATAS